MAYLRVSTSEQGASGLGLEAQRDAIVRFAHVHGYEIAQGDWFQEIASGKGADAMERRPILAHAMRQAKRLKGFLICAKLDRLSRNTHFVTGLLEKNVRFRVADLGDEADNTYLRFLAVLSEREREQISKRTSEALQAAKRRGTILGNPQNLREVAQRGAVTNARQADDFATRVFPAILRARAAGNRTYREIARTLTNLGVKTARDGEWHPDTVRRLEERHRQQEGDAAPLSPPTRPRKPRKTKPLAPTVTSSNPAATRVAFRRPPRRLLLDKTDPVGT